MTSDSLELQIEIVFAKVVMHTKARCRVVNVKVSRATFIIGCIRAREKTTTSYKLQKKIFLSIIMNG